MRAFIRLRRLLASNRELARRLDELEKKYDAQFKIVFDAIRQLMSSPEPGSVPPKRRIVNRGSWSGLQYCNSLRTIYQKDLNYLKIG